MSLRQVFLQGNVEKCIALKYKPKIRSESERFLSLEAKKGEFFYSKRKF
jgi:hypothetical protein